MGVIVQSSSSTLSRGIIILLCSCSAGILYVCVVPCRLFRVCFSVKFAEKGSNQRKEQEQAYVHFVDFLDECAGKFHS